MTLGKIRLGVAVCIGAMLSIAACGGGSPASPSRSASTTQVQLGVAGNGSATVAPGESRQLFATATNSNGTTTDVTSLAMWQSSNPVLATVSAGGLLTGAAEGDVEVSATYQSVRGTLRALVRRPVCNLTVIPASASYDAFGGTASVQVSVSPADCTWTAQSDASPEAAVFAAAGGTGAFDVITSPADCSWFARTTAGDFGVFIASGFNGIGARRVTYTVEAHTRSVDVDGFIEIHGLSGLNPPGRHRVTILKR